VLLHLQVDALGSAFFVGDLILISRANANADARPSGLKHLDTVALPACVLSARRAYGRQVSPEHVLQLSQPLRMLQLLEDRACSQV